MARGRACVNIEAEMEGERKWRGRKGPFAHECVSLSSVHTLCHCGAAFDTVAGVLEPRGLKACDFTCQIQESGTLPLTKKGYEEEGVDDERIATPLCATRASDSTCRRGIERPKSRGASKPSSGREKRKTQSIIATRGLFASPEAAPRNHLLPGFLDNGSKERQIRPGKHKYFGEYNGEVYK